MNHVKAKKMKTEPIEQDHLQYIDEGLFLY